MSGILLNKSSRGNLFARCPLRRCVGKGRFYFYANGFVGGRDSL
ncbi:MAG TPA: phosphoribosylformyl-glycineamide synthetase [Atlantibacter hermannii]|nr:phosphoribosylformyl-glycineamide synthetase [Atlantibacter hermannii]